ncbi:unnamed protein product, partial [Rotaria sordida]
DWIMGSRWAKEDEFEGLDLTAHGESWQVTASRAVSDLVKKFLDEQGITKEEAEDNGTLELHYTPNHPNKKAFKIPLLKQIQSRHSRIDNDPANNNQVQQNLNKTKFDDNEINRQPINVHIIRL